MSSKLTHKNLYTLVVEEIEKRVKYNPNSSYKDQSSRASVSPVTGDGRSDASTAELITAVQNLLSEALPAMIIDGLIVSATSPISSNVVVSAGSGSVGGVLYTLEEEATVTIPFDVNVSLYYIVLYKNRIIVEKTFSPNKLTIAKIVVPNPAKTVLIQDTKDKSWNAYIVNFHEYKLYGFNDQFEEDTVELLRNNISPILADNLIGNIRLTEDLKIINTQGTLELDSKELRILDSDENILSKFNQYGTFFYDDLGRELARFAITGAKVGNISILPNSIQSGDFISGYTGRGFQIKDDGSAQFHNILVRGELRSAVFRQDEIQVSNGDLVVTKGSILDLDLNTTETTVTVKDSFFQTNDILLLKNETKQEYLQVTSGNSTTITVTRNFDGNGSYTWNKGDVIALMDHRIALVASGDTIDNLPYIDVIERNSSVLSDEEIKVRIGNLNGIGLAGKFGIYTIGDFLVGDQTSDNYMYYNGDTGVLTITGDIILGGSSTPPDDVAFFNVQQFEDVLVFRLSPVLNVDLAGYELRTGPTWNTASFVDFFTGTIYELRFFPPGLNQYWIKARDFAGNYSVNSIGTSIIVLRRPGVNPVFVNYEWGKLGSPIEMWEDEKITIYWENYRNANFNSQVLSAKTTNRWDAYDSDWDTAEDASVEWDFPKTPGFYYIEIKPLDFGQTLTVSHSVNVSNISDEGALFGLEDRTSLDGITWTDWHYYTPGFIQARYWQLRAWAYKPTGYEYHEFINTVSLFDMADIILTVGSVAIAAGGTTITFDRTFIYPPTVLVTAISNTALIPIINPSLITPTGFHCQLRDPEIGSGGVSGMINYYAKGY